MKPFHSLTFTTIVLFLVLVNMQNTPKFTEAGPATTATCILACCGTACASASAVCKQKKNYNYVFTLIEKNSFKNHLYFLGLPLGAATGPFGVIAAVGCFLAAGGGCAACVSICLPTVSLPTP